MQSVSSLVNANALTTTTGDLVEEVDCGSRWSESGCDHGTDDA